MARMKEYEMSVADWILDKHKSALDIAERYLGSNKSLPVFVEEEDMDEAAFQYMVDRMKATIKRLEDRGNDAEAMRMSVVNAKRAYALKNYGCYVRFTTACVNDPWEGCSKNLTIVYGCNSDGWFISIPEWSKSTRSGAPEEEMKELKSKLESNDDALQNAAIIAYEVYRTEFYDL